MKSLPSQPHRLLRTTIASAAFALLAACGGGGNSSSSSSPSAPAKAGPQVVAFGTSLSDAGTYSPEIAPAFGGGRFTTNPGQVWTQDVAQYFGTALTPAFEGGFGVPLSPSGGLDYAQGGAQISLGGNINSTTATEMPVTWQIQKYLSAHGSFNTNQLVLVEGGANEILNFVENSSTTQGFAALGANLQSSTAQAAMAPTGPIVTAIMSNAALAPVFAKMTSAQQSAYVLGQYMLSQASAFPGAAAIIQAANTLASQVQTQILGNGGKNVAVVDVPDIGVTYAGYEADQTTSTTGPSQLMTDLAGAYNITLYVDLLAQISTGSVAWVDSFSWIDSVVQNYQAYGFTVANTATACNLPLMVQNATTYATANPSVVPAGETVAQYASAFASSLFCSPQTLVSANAPSTYMFADQVHPTTALHALFAKFVEQTLATSGITPSSL